MSIMLDNVDMTSFDDSTIGGRIRFARLTKAKMTQAQLAKATAMTEPIISRIENGRRQVKPGELITFAKQLGVSKAYLEDGGCIDDTAPFVSEFEKHFSKITTADKYTPPKEVYTATDFWGATVTLDGEYLVLESNTGIFDLAVAIAKINGNSHLTELERKNRVAKAKKKFAEKGAGGEMKTYFVLTPEQLDEIVERRTRKTIRLRRTTTHSKTDDEE